MPTTTPATVSGLLRCRGSGVITVSLAVDRSGTVLAGPEIASRGFVYMKENEPLLEELKKAVLAALAERGPDVPIDRELMSATVRMAVRQFANQRFRRRPVVLPIILEV